MGEVILWRPRSSRSRQTAQHDSPYQPIMDVMKASAVKLCTQCAEVSAERCYYPKCPLYVGPGSA